MFIVTDNLHRCMLYQLLLIILTAIRYTNYSLSVGLWAFTKTSFFSREPNKSENMLSLLSSCSARLFLPAIHSSTPSRIRVSSSRLHLSSINSGSQMSSSSTDPSTLPSTTHTPNPDDVLIQYVVLRRDLIDSWPLGSIVTQGCHAAVSAIWIHKDDKNAVDYCSPENIDSMHKVTLEVKGETQIKNLSEKLTASSIDHKLWIEQPENIPTCIATKPYPKSVVSSFFKKLKLCK